MDWRSLDEQFPVEDDKISRHGGCNSHAKRARSAIGRNLRSCSSTEQLSFNSAVSRDDVQLFVIRHVHRFRGVFPCFDLSGLKAGFVNERVTRIRIRRPQRCRCRDATRSHQTRFDHRSSVTEFVTADGALLRSFSPEIMEAAYKATEETMNEFGKTNARFKKIYESVRAQVKEGYQWWQVCELPFDTFQVSAGTDDLIDQCHL